MTAINSANDREIFFITRRVPGRTALRNRRGRDLHNAVDNGPIQRRRHGLAGCRQCLLAGIKSKRPTAWQLVDDKRNQVPPSRNC